MIVDAGVLVVDPDTGNPAILYDGSNDFLRSATSGLIVSTAYEAFMTYYSISSEANGVLLSDSNGRYLGSIENTSTSTEIGNMGTVSFRKNGSAETPSTRDDVHTLYHDSNLNLIGMYGTVGVNAIPNLQPYSYLGGTVFSALCYGSEFIAYPSSQSANRTGIESNINTHYGIY